MEKTIFKAQYRFYMLWYEWIRLAVTNPVTTSSLNLSTVFRNLQQQWDSCLLISECVVSHRFPDCHLASSTRSSDAWATNWLRWRRLLLSSPWSRERMNRRVTNVSSTHLATLCGSAEVLLEDGIVVVTNNHKVAGHFSLKACKVDSKVTPNITPPTCIVPAANYLARSHLIGWC